MPESQTITSVEEPVKAHPTFRWDLSAPVSWAGYRNENLSPQNRMIMGNLVSGAALGGIGALSVPILQKLFPGTFNRFPSQRKRLMLALGLGGIALPWAVTALPMLAGRSAGVSSDVGPSQGGDMYKHVNSAMDKINSCKEPKKEKIDWGERLKRMKERRGETKVSNFGMSMDSIFGGPRPTRAIDRATAYRGILEAAANPHDPMSATDAAWAIKRVSGMGDPKRNWITPGSIAAAAIGAGLGGATGAALAQGIDFFFKASPKTKKRLTWGGAGLGALLSAARVIPND